MHNGTIAHPRQYGTRPPRRQSHRGRILVFGLIVAVAIFGIGHAVEGRHATNPNVAASTRTAATNSTSGKTTSQTHMGSSSPSANAAPKTTACSDNTLSQLIVISISNRHLWACDGTAISYDSAVVTGMENLPADLTPTGTYHIYGKQTNLYLNGSDSTGSWHDYVYYWMPFLSNQYGQYGFHDATWRASNAFGNISPYSSDASHGCVELPLATAKWLYNWASVGTTVSIVS